MTDTWCLIANVHAGKGSVQKRLASLCKAMDAGNIPYQLHTSSSLSESKKVIAQAAANGCRSFISVGGDGTHHHLVNNLMQLQSNAEFTIAAFSAGSGNDWVKTIHQPSDPEEFVRMLKTGKIISHSVGEVTYTLESQTHQRNFINVAGMLLDAHVVRVFPDKYKKIRLLPMYLLAGLWHLLKYKPPEVFVSSEGKELRGRFLTIHAGICKYSGGGMQFVPHAEPTKRTFAVTCIRKMPVIRHLLNTWRLYNGSILSFVKATGFESSSLRIESSSGVPIPVEADGEFLGFTPVEVVMSGVKLKVVVP